MSAPRLILKQPTGWFAAGREFTQAITILSDGAFKLYVHACLMANRHTGRLSATVDEFARAMTRAPTAVALNLDELEALAVCRMVRSGGSQLVIEISDRFWPYQKQQPQGRTAEPEQEFVQKVRVLFLAPACVHASFSAADEKLAMDLYRRGVSMEQVTRAILLGCARKYVSMLNAKVRTPITSLQYFADIVEEVNESAIPESYWEPLRAKVVRMEQQWQNAHPARP
jgi:HAMP domain-containing protein